MDNNIQPASLKNDDIIRYDNNSVNICSAIC